MSNVSSWSTTAASNNSPAPNGAPEGMAPSGVNDVIRENMAAVSKFYKDTQGTIVSTGSANAYVLTTNSAHASLAAQSIIAFRANFANTGAATVNVDGLGAKQLNYNGGTLQANVILEDVTYMIAYNSDSDAYDIVSSFNIDREGLGSITRIARTSNTIITASNNSDLIQVTSGTFSQTFDPAANLLAGFYMWYYNAGSGVVTLDPNSTETINGASTLAIQQGVIALITCDGSNLFAVLFSQYVGTHEVLLHTGNSFGATNTKIMRYVTAATNTGTAITYADSATLGASLTINETGIYHIAIANQSGGTAYFGASVNSAELTTNIESITAANRICVSTTTVSAALQTVSAMVKLTAGDVVRPHTDGNVANGNATSTFKIMKVGI